MKGCVSEHFPKWLLQFVTLLLKNQETRIILTGGVWKWLKKDIQKHKVVQRPRNRDWGKRLRRMSLIKKSVKGVKLLRIRWSRITAFINQSRWKILYKSFLKRLLTNLQRDENINNSTPMTHSGLWRQASPFHKCTTMPNLIIKRHSYKSRFGKIIGRANSYKLLDMSYGRILPTLTCISFMTSPIIRELKKFCPSFLSHFQTVPMFNILTASQCHRRSFWAWQELTCQPQCEWLHFDPLACL